MIKDDVADDQRCRGRVDYKERFDSTLYAIDDKLKKAEDKLLET